MPKFCVILHKITRKVFEAFSFQLLMFRSSSVPFHASFCCSGHLFRSVPASTVQKVPCPVFCVSY